MLRDRNRSKTPRAHEWKAAVEYQHYLDFQNSACFRVAVDCIRDAGDDIVCDLTFQDVFAVAKDARPLSPEEVYKHSQEVDTSKMKEIKSWHDHRTGSVMTIREYIQQTSLKPLPSRWLIEWKVKESVYVIKCRLVAKGFAESNQQNMFTYSPTATRTGHRLVILQAAFQEWEVWSLDVSTAFFSGVDLQ